MTYWLAYFGLLWRGPGWWRLQAVLRHTSVESFRAIAAMPLWLTPIFAAIAPSAWCSP
jgi:hypothetical protein